MYKVNQELVAVFDANRNLERAQKMEAYMKNKFSYFGVMATERKELAKQVYRTVGVPENGIECAKELFGLPQRELHYVAQELILKTHKQWTENNIVDLEWFLTTNSWWDTVDYIASNLVGKYFQKFPESLSTFTSKWNQSTNMWLVRTAILFQLKYKEKTDEKLLSKFILAHNNEKEFFIKKAIGWALREYAKTNSNWVLNFVKNHPLEPLSYKEATKHLEV